MKRKNKIILLGFMIICLSTILFFSIKTYKNSNTFETLILNENYKNTEFSTLEVGGILKETAEYGLSATIKDDTINEVINTLKDVKIKNFEGLEYDTSNFLTLKFTGSDEAYLEVVIVDNKVMLIQTSASSNERFSAGYEIINTDINLIEDLVEISKDYIK